MSQGCLVWTVSRSPRDAHCATYSGEFVVELPGTDDTGHQTLVVTEQGETGSSRSDDGIQQGVAVETGILDEAAALVELH